MNNTNFHFKTFPNHFKVLALGKIIVTFLFGVIKFQYFLSLSTSTEVDSLMDDSGDFFLFTSFQG